MRMTKPADLEDLDEAPVGSVTRLTDVEAAVNGDWDTSDVSIDDRTVGSTNLVERVGTCFATLSLAQLGVEVVTGSTRPVVGAIIIPWSS